jgi:hypothetical protein
MNHTRSQKDDLLISTQDGKMPQEHVLNVSSTVISLHYFPIN